MDASVSENASALPPPIGVQLPPGRGPERRYAAELLLGHVMGLPLRMEPSEGAPGATRLLLPQGRVLSLADTFFAGLDPHRPLHDAAHLPAGPAVLSRVLGPVPYGAEGLHDTAEGLHLEADVLGSTFLLATAWEELTLAGQPERHDAHGRLRPEATWAGRLQLTDRPLVHEWGEALAGLLRRLGYPAAPPARAPSLLPTHDLDQLWFYTSWAKRLAVAVGRPLGLWGRYVSRAPSALAGLHSADPYATLPALMDAAEAVGARAVFFVPGAVRRGPHDAPQPIAHPSARQLWRAVVQRGHALGLHPSHRSAEAPLLWAHELRRVQQATGAPIDWVRPHYLRGALQHVWLRAASLGIGQSASAGYATRLGFRTGLCIPYPVFSVIERRELPVREHPLVAMEVAPFAQRPETGAPSLAPEALAAQWAHARHLVRRSRGQMSFDWHNSTVATPAWAPYAPTLWATYRD